VEPPFPLRDHGAVASVPPPIDVQAACPTGVGGLCFWSGLPDRRLGSTPSRDWDGAGGGARGCPGDGLPAAVPFSRRTRAGMAAIPSVMVPVARRVRDELNARASAAGPAPPVRNDTRAVRRAFPGVPRRRALLAAGVCACAGLAILQESGAPTRLKGSDPHGTIATGFSSRRGMPCPRDISARCSG
jgi:hypothetical protein